MNKTTWHLSVFFAISLLFPVTLFSQSVVIGTGTAISVFSPLNRTNDYCVYEVIYLASEINMPGNISNIGFQRHDGTNTDSIENVEIYLKHTPVAQLSAGTYDTSGYTLVYSGSFPNDVGAGWREVACTFPFYYNGTSNLQVLVSKGYQPACANTPVTPRWIYTNINPSPQRARRYYDDIAISSTTPLTLTSFTSNARLTFGTTGIAEIYPGNVSVYPNPGAGAIHFRINSTADNLELRIINSEGQLIRQMHASNAESISIDNLRAGIYFYSFSVKNEHISSGKFVVVE